MLLCKLQQWKVLQLFPRNWAHQVPMLMMIFNPKISFIGRKVAFLVLQKQLGLGVLVTNNKIVQRHQHCPMWIEAEIQENPVIMG